MTDAPNLISSGEASRILSVHPATLIRWIKKGTIVTAGKVSGQNGAYLFTRDEVERVKAGNAA